MTVADMRQVATDVVMIGLVDAEGKELPVWKPGAHIDLTMAGGITRQYSLCGRPDRTELWRLGILKVPDGRGGSRFIHDSLKVGDTVTVSQPRNSFPLYPAKSFLFIAGGIGITPIIPMLSQVAAERRPWKLLYGGRTEASMAFREEISAIGGGEIEFRPQDLYGLLDLRRALGEYVSGRAVYCCGPEPLLSAIETLTSGWPSNAIRKERFTAAPSNAATTSSFKVELARSGRRLDVPKDKPLLRVLEEAGCKISNSCRAGICGTCAVGVVSGEPDHRDDILSDSQRAEGKLMMPCVSRSKSPLLVLDL